MKNTGYASGHTCRQVCRPQKRRKLNTLNPFLPTVHPAPLDDRLNYAVAAAGAPSTTALPPAFSIFSAADLENLWA